MKILTLTLFLSFTFITIHAQEQIMRCYDQDSNLVKLYEGDWLIPVFHKSYDARVLKYKKSERYSLTEITKDSVYLKSDKQHLAIAKHTLKHVLRVDPATSPKDLKNKPNLALIIGIIASLIGVIGITSLSNSNKDNTPESGCFLYSILIVGIGLLITGAIIGPKNATPKHTKEIHLNNPSWKCEYKINP